MIWVVVPLRRVVPCSLCDGEIVIPGYLRGVEQIDAAVTHHIREHVEQALTEARPTCARCKRVPLDSGLPHRPCFLADCLCDCSYAPKEG